MAHVDLETEKIFDCKKGTYTWYHEKSHILFGKTKLGELIRFREEMARLFLPVVISMTIFFNNLLTKITLGVYLIYWIFLYQFEEVWCWINAIKLKRLSNVIFKSS